MYAVAHIATEGAHMLGLVNQPLKGDAAMRHNTNRSFNPPEMSVAWRKAEYAALRANAKDSFDDRVSDDIFDIEDERAALDSYAQGKMRFAN